MTAGQGPAASGSKSVGPGAKTAGESSVAGTRSQGSLVVKPLPMPLPESEPKAERSVRQKPPPRAAPAPPAKGLRDLTPFTIKMSALVASVLMVATAGALLYFVVWDRIHPRQSAPTAKEIPREAPKGGGAKIGP